jgi:hypothetical protein
LIVFVKWGNIMKQYNFRLWLTKMWIENKEEHQVYGESEMKLVEYFNRYKYWLKREYRYQQLINK